MKVYNEEKTMILNDYDLKKGYLKEDRIIIESIPEQEEISHYEFNKYENGGIDKIKVIEQPHIPKHDIYETIYVFIPFSNKEIAENSIEEIKNWFESEYSYKEQKFRRLIALNKLDDDGVDAKTKLTELYIEAESKRTKIQMLENEV